MIYTITLNPALDRALEVDGLLHDETTRIQSETVYAAGKGIDVSRVISELEGRSVALGLLGGYAGLQLEGLLVNAGVLTDFTRIAGETRTNIILKERTPGRQYVIGAAGPEVKAAEIGQFNELVRDLKDVNYLVISGSLPRGVRPEFYGQLVLAGRKHGAFVALDADGTALTEGVECGPNLIKPNIHELGRLVGGTPTTDEEILAACDQLHARNIPLVMVSRGPKGLLLSGEGRRIKAVGPVIKADSVVGAGDSTVAGFILGHCRGQALEDCLRLACAAGTATAGTPGTELCHRPEVERLLPLIEVTAL
jgi:6-phosphofructokinase 2|nr:1-phosphofructokinase family hexose kinase [Candidatus Krumholzibacteria bacterium]